MREETCCHHMGYSFRVTARVLLYAPSHIQDSTYHGLCYTSHGALAGTRNSSMGPSHEGSIRRPIAPLQTLLPWNYISLPLVNIDGRVNCKHFLTSLSDGGAGRWESIVGDLTLVMLCVHSVHHELYQRLDDGGHRRGADLILESSMV